MVAEDAGLSQLDDDLSVQKREEVIGCQSYEDNTRLNDELMVQSLGEQAPAHSCERLFNQAVGYLAKAPRPVVVDEVENGLSDIKVLETVRDISDTVDIPVVFLGREYVKGTLWRHKHFRSCCRNDTVPLRRS